MAEEKEENYMTDFKASPFYGNEDAYNPMFDEVVFLVNPDGKEGRYVVSIFNDGTSDPLDDGMMDTDLEEITVVFGKRDWKFVQKVKRGATLRRGIGNKNYTVYDAKWDAALGWIIQARGK